MAAATGTVLYTYAKESGEIIRLYSVVCETAADTLTVSDMTTVYLLAAFPAATKESGSAVSVSGSTATNVITLLLQKSDNTDADAFTYPIYLLVACVT